jgi:dihydroorotase
MVGLETALSIVQLAMVETGLLDWSGVATVLSRQPSVIGGVDDVAGVIAEGRIADLVFVDPTWRSALTTDDLAGKSINSPYLGMDLPGRVVHTVRHGYFTKRDGVVVSADVVSRATREFDYAHSGAGTEVQNG